MPDREKVIKELSELHGSKETMEIIEQAIALLKVQEAVEPILEKLKFSETWVCGNCQNELFVGDVIRDNYCSNCGRKVQWDA